MPSFLFVTPFIFFLTHYTKRFKKKYAHCWWEEKINFIAKLIQHQYYHWVTHFHRGNNPTSTTDVRCGFPPSLPFPVMMENGKHIYKAEGAPICECQQVDRLMANLDSTHFWLTSCPKHELSFFFFFASLVSEECCYGLHCVPVKLMCWNPSAQDLRKWLLFGHWAFKEMIRWKLRC